MKLQRVVSFSAVLVQVSSNVVAHSYLALLSEVVWIGLMQEEHNFRGDLLQTGMKR